MAFSSIYLSGCFFSSPICFLLFLFPCGFETQYFHIFSELILFPHWHKTEVPWCGRGLPVLQTVYRNLNVIFITETYTGSLLIPICFGFPSTASCFKIPIACCFSFMINHPWSSAYDNPDISWLSFPWVRYSFRNLILHSSRMVSHSICLQRICISWA